MSRNDKVPRFLVLAALLGLIVLPATVGAQQSSDKQLSPGVWYDITKKPEIMGTYGAGLTSTKRVLERCTALLWSIEKHHDGNVPKYRRDYQTGYCLGWINSSMAFVRVRNEAGGHLLGVCLPDDIDSRQVAEAFITYAHNNREHLIYNPSRLIYWALLEKYPCPK